VFFIRAATVATRSAWLASPLSNRLCGAELGERAFDPPGPAPPPPRMTGEASASGPMPMPASGACDPTALNE